MHLKCLILVSDTAMVTLTTLSISAELILLNCACLHYAGCLHRRGLIVLSGAMKSVSLHVRLFTVAEAHYKRHVLEWWNCKWSIYHSKYKRGHSGTGALEMYHHKPGGHYLRVPPVWSKIRGYFLWDFSSCQLFPMHQVNGMQMRRVWMLWCLPHTLHKEPDLIISSGALWIRKQEIIGLSLSLGNPVVHVCQKHILSEGRRVTRVITVPSHH